MGNGLKGRLFLALVLLLPVGCSSDNDGVDQAGQPVSDSFHLVRVTSDQELAGILKAGIDNRTSSYSAWGMEGMEDLAGAPNAGGGTGASVSSTNLQISGVDEADLIKNDADYLYQLKPSEYYPYYAAGSRAATGNQLRIFKMLSAPERAELVSEIELGSSTDPAMDGLYLVTDRGDQAPDLLVTLAGRSSSWPEMWFDPWYWNSGRTHIGLYDVSNPSEPAVVTNLELDGSLISSRRIGETLYLITRYQPGLGGYLPYPYTEQEVQADQELLNAAALPDLLPALRVDQSAEKPLVSASDCYVIPTFADDLQYGDIITITAIDLANPAQPTSQCLVGATETVFVSNTALYLASTRYRYDWSTTGGEGDPVVVSPGGSGIEGDTGSTETTETVEGSSPAGTSPEEAGSTASLAYQETTYTDIHKFSLDGNRISYRGSGSVAGHLGWEQDKKPFRFGELAGALGVVTSVGETWSGTATTHLTILQDSGVEGAELSILSELPNDQHPESLGKTGEQLYAARFVGDKLYLVTFRITDPLYAIDLSDPAAPMILGELSIPGYSDYLHPVGDDLLLGIGRSAIADDSNIEGGDGRGAWYQGVKLSLFDVSQPTQPVELQSISIGKRGSDAAVLHDHHGFVSLMTGQSGSTLRFALPISRNDGVPAHEDTSDPWTYYDWTDTSLHLFELDTTPGSAAITAIGEVTAETAQGPYSYPEAHVQNDRAVLTSTGVHYSHGGRLWSADWLDSTNSTGAQ